MTSAQKPHTMTSRERFLETMQYGKPDRVPYFEEGLREEVLACWRRQGLSSTAELNRRFPSDKRERIEINLEPIPRLKHWPTSLADLDKFRRHLKLDEHRRLPRKWLQRARAWRKRDHVLMLYVHQGFFLSMGVQDWRRFHDVMLLTMDQPELVRQMMQIQGELAARLTQRLLNEVDVDAAVFSEPIGGNDRPLIGPAMYEDFVLKSYVPVKEVLQHHGVPVILFQTYANAAILVPSILRWGFNCLWACEVNVDAMDYRRLRSQFGRQLRLIGGIDLDALRQGREAIKREVETNVPPLLQEGGYVPLADGRVREDVHFDNYVYYRQLVQEITQGSF